MLEKIHAEMGRAHAARADGNEGRARVCARRAAGWAVGVYGRDQLGRDSRWHAYDNLIWLQSQEDVSEDLREAANRLTTRVDIDHTLPHREDPLEDARVIITALLKGVN
jgi:hypothetical protein